MGLVDLLGATLQGKNGDVATESLAANEVVGLYFSAHWCPPCRGFTPALAKQYEQLKAAGKKLEVVFVSSDKSDKEHAEYYGEQPWLSLPFSDRKKKEELSKMFKVRGIPTLVLLNGAGELLTKDGRTAIMDAEAWPFIPPSLGDLLAGDLLTKEGVTSLKQLQAEGTEHLFLYFSAHWCPPCKAFTPKLCETYSTLKAAGKKVAMIFVSSDHDEEAFNEYYGSMPFFALPYAARAAKEKLSAFFEVQGIPTLVGLDAQTLEVINGDCRGAVMSDPAGANFPWPPPLVHEYDEEGAEELNEIPALVVLAEKAEDEWDGLEGALAEVAKERKAAKQPPLSFGICKEQGGIGGQIRKLCKLGAPAKQPACVLLDLADEGGFYAGPEAITADAVRALLDGFAAKSLPRLQVGA